MVSVIPVAALLLFSIGFPNPKNLLNSVVRGGVFISLVIVIVMNP